MPQPRHGEPLDDAADRLSLEHEIMVGDASGASWALEELLDVHAAHGEIDAAEVRSLVAELDQAHDEFDDGDLAEAEAHVRAVVERIDTLVERGSLPPDEAEELIALAQATIDMGAMESVPDHFE